MSCIVCATRGGAGSRAAQEQAIDFARESGGKLVFLYVVDPSIVNDTEEKVQAAVRHELYWIGRTLLGIAQKRAENLEIPAEVTIREGKVADEICRFLEERSAEILFLGAPRGTTANIFGDDAIERFASSIEQESRVKVEVVRPEDRPLDGIDG